MSIKKRSEYCKGESLDVAVAVLVGEKEHMFGIVTRGFVKLCGCHKLGVNAS